MVGPVQVMLLLEEASTLQRSLVPSEDLGHWCDPEWEGGTPESQTWVQIPAQPPSSWVTSVGSTQPGPNFSRL